jgi:hypothetical protein
MFPQRQLKRWARAAQILDRYVYHGVQYGKSHLVIVQYAYDQDAKSCFEKDLAGFLILCFLAKLWRPLLSGPHIGSVW